MKFNKLLLVTGLISGNCLAETALAQTQNFKSPENTPNVIIIITDDQGYGDLSCHYKVLIN